MPFRFRLETVLRLRRSVERQRELQLQHANSALVQLGNKIQQIETSLRESARRRDQQLAASASGAELHFDLACRDVILKQRQELLTELERATERRQQCLEDYKRALRDCEILETVRRQQLEAHKHEEERQEQRRLEDLLLLRRTAPRRS